MLGFFLHQTFSEPVLPAQAVQDLLKSLFAFFIAPLLLLVLSCVIASRAGHSTFLHFSAGEKLIVLSNSRPSDEGSRDQRVGADGQNPTVFCESVTPAKENNP